MVLEILVSDFPQPVLQESELWEQYPHNAVEPDLAVAWGR
jgi:hypothetical protein